jgi:hypothetical protein
MLFIWYKKVGGKMNTDNIKKDIEAGLRKNIPVLLKTSSRVVKGLAVPAAIEMVKKTLHEQGGLKGLYTKLRNSL